MGTSSLFRCRMTLRKRILQTLLSGNKGDRQVTSDQIEPHCWAGGLTQVIQHLPSKCKAPSSNSVPQKKKSRSTLTNLYPIDVQIKR
jgi:hypothetical protein